MRLKSWPGRSARACAIISLLAGGVPAAAAAQSPAAAPVPAIALVDAADAPQWQALAASTGWRVIVPAAADNPDARVQALEAAVLEAEKQGADPERIYLAGRGAATAAVFYTISRVPDLWAAAIGIDGSPQPAIDTGRVFAANFRTVPVLWISKAEGDQAFAARLKNAGLNIEWRAAAGATNRSVLDWLAGHRREAFPATIDCETNAPSFARCYWIQMTRFDPSERNDMVPSTRVSTGSGAYLNLGGFEFNTADPGPGIAVTLPPHYDGPLRKGDRIVELEGRPIADGAAYMEMLGRYQQDKSVVATVQRGKARVRIDTSVSLPRRDATVTARVQARYVPSEQEIQISSRTVTAMRVTIPWPVATMYWNGVALDHVESPGCYVLSQEEELLHAVRCH